MTTSHTPHGKRFNPFAGLRVALTGGTSGLGLALLRALRKRGAEVAFVARDAERVARIAAAHPGSHGIAGDVADKRQIHPVALQLNAALGGIDLLIHNASSLGPVPLRPLADTECEDFEAALATNLLGPFRLTRALLGALAASAREGRPAAVLHIGSDAAVTPYAGWGAYGAGKAAARHMAAIWDAELAPSGIRVFERDPGDMDTPLHAQAVPEADPATLQPPAQAAEVLLDWLAGAWLAGSALADEGSVDARLADARLADARPADVSPEDARSSDRGPANVRPVNAGPGSAGLASAGPAEPGLAHPPAQIMQPIAEEAAQ